MSIAQQNAIEELRRRAQLIEDAYAVVISNMTVLTQRVNDLEAESRETVPSRTLTLPEKRKPNG